MNNMDHINENIAEANQAEANMLNEKEKSLIKQVKAIYKSRIKVDCTNCKYCMPCPYGVDIPENFSFYNNAFIFNDIEGSKNAYHGQMKPDMMANMCQACGQCESLCPQNIQIIHELENVWALFKK